MRNPLRLAIASVALLVSAACSRSSEQPALSDDLKQDLARAGGAQLQLAGSASGRVEIVSAAERTNGAVAAPKAPAVARAPSAVRGRTAVVKSPQRVARAAAEPAPRAVETAPEAVYTPAPVPQPAPEPAPSQARPRAPQPSTQREPPGGWRSPSEVIRNAPFPINPVRFTRAG